MEEVNTHKKLWKHQYCGLHFQSRKDKSIQILIYITGMKQINLKNCLIQAIPFEKKVIACRMENPLPP